MPQNQAAWLVEGGKPFEKRDAPMPEIDDDEVLLRNEYSTVGPLETYQQPLGFLVDHFPIIIGCDVAGTIVKAGSAVKDYKEGDRVIGLSAAFSTKLDKHGAYQHYVAIRPRTLLPLPKNVSFEDGVVLPLSIVTVAIGLFGKSQKYLALDLPQSPRPDNKAKVIFVPGGATAVGTVALQLLAHAGYSVVTTASSRNADLLKKLGASAVVDYSHDNVASEVVKAMKTLGMLHAVLDASGKESSYDLITHIFKQLEPVPVAGVQRTPTTFPHHSEWCIASRCFEDDAFIGEHLFGVDGYITRALADGSFVPSPRAVIGGEGLDGVQKALDTYMKDGASAAKYVIRL